MQLSLEVWRICAFPKFPYYAWLINTSLPILMISSCLLGMGIMVAMAQEI
jgi:hypothetical protein